MTQLNVNEVVHNFVKWRNNAGRKTDWTSFHENKINDIRRKFTSGEIAREQVAQHVHDSFVGSGIHIDPSEKRELERMIKRY